MVWYGSPASDQNAQNLHILYRIITILFMELEPYFSPNKRSVYSIKYKIMVKLMDNLSYREGKAMAENVILLGAPGDPPEGTNPLGNKFIVGLGGFLTTDLEGNILDADHAIAVLLQNAVHRLRGKPLGGFLALEELANLQVVLKTARQQPYIQQWQTNLKLREETTMAITLVVAPIANEQERLRWLLWQGHSDLPPVLPGTESDAQIPTELEARTTELAAANQRLQIELFERQRAEAAAAQRARELSALHQATTALLSTLDLQTLLGQILDNATSAIPSAEKGMIHLIARDTGQLEMRATIGYTDARIQKFTFPGSKGYVARAVQGRKPLLLQDAQTDPSIRFNGSIPEVRAIQSVIVAPLIQKDEVLGALSLESSHRRAFNEDDLRLLVTFAATATTAIHNAQLHAEVQKLAITDGLTGLYNRRGFDELGKREIERLRRFGHPLAAMMIDIDIFKNINDSYGHHTGDQVIQHVAKRLAGSLREVDILGRFGGDEFNVLLPETDLFTASSVAERLRVSVQDTPILIETVPIKVTISIGVAKAAADIPNLDTLLGRADKALYIAKQGGRNRVEMG